MTTDKLTIVAQFRAEPGRAAELESLLRGLVAPTRAEEGCELYDLHRSLETEGLFHFHEVWTTKPQWEAHMQAPHLRAFQAASEGMVARFDLWELERIE